MDMKAEIEELRNEIAQLKNRVITLEEDSKVKDELLEEQSNRIDGLDKEVSLLKEMIYDLFNWAFRPMHKWLSRESGSGKIIKRGNDEILTKYPELKEDIYH